MPKTLLLADDSVTIQKVVGISFANEDVRLITVDNGDAAIARARQDRPDVILADVVMPGKSGYEVCEAIKADPNLRHIPVLLLTGTFEAFDEARATRAGAAGHVAKPFESQLLVEQVKRLLAQSEQQRSAPPRQAAPPATPAPARATAPAARAPSPPAPPPAKAAADDSFEFFNEDFAEPAASPDASATASNDDAFALDENDSSFAFGDSELSALEPDPAPAARPRTPAPSPGERTVAILPDEAPPATRPVAIEPLEDLAVGDESDDAEFAPLDAPASAGSDAFEFEFDPVSPAAGRDGSLRVDSDDLAQATVLDPNGASGFDVSSSDLRERETAPPRAAAPRFEPTVSAEDSFAGVHAEIADEAEFAPLAADELDESSLEVLEPPRPAPPARRAPAPAPESRPALGASAEPLLEALAPQLRAQLHDTLEKIAWESFSSVTEQIVRQALERVETIAWEVIPQMAETLVREEIRRMKGKAD
ncbi:MAG TPA: response regulator [Myxococcota bacterium]|jgi:CheY-like chemotaxis protein